MARTMERFPDAGEAVREFYERLPYPRPIESLDNCQRLSHDAQRRRADFHLHWPSTPFRDDHAILIAGCGTSQAAKHAMRWPNAQVTGVDFSGESVRCTEALKRKYGLDNLQLRQLPIERVGELGTGFDQIVCTGVLHHLANPDAGLAALREVLKPDGAMHLMVYAPFGRTGVYLLQEYCRMLGIGTSAKEIADLAASLKALPPDHPIAPLLRHAPDFGNEAGLADALLHPQDRAYSVPQLFAFLAGAGLRFGRWLRQAAYLPQCGALASAPHAPLLARLPPHEQYAAVELFRGSMVRHSVVAYRNDSPARDLVPFAGDAWLRYVPLRLPDTIVVQERLPAGAAAVLINPAHTYTDLYLPVDAQQKRFFDAIDGRRSIGQIASHPAQHDAARILFERLWQYDQVVFDASTAAATGERR